MIKYKEILFNNTCKWIHIEDPDQKEIDKLHHEYKIPLDFVTDMFDPYEVARAEFLERNDSHPKLILLEYAYFDDEAKEGGEYIAAPLSIIVFQNRIITLSKETPEILEDIYEHFFDPTDPPEKPLVDEQDFILEIFYRNERKFINALRRILGEIERLQIDIQESSTNRELYRQMAIEKSIVLLKAGIKNNRSVIEIVQKHPLNPHTEAHDNKMHDVLTESYQAEQMAQTCSSLSEHLSSLFENVIANNLNLIMKVLTSITIIMTIPTIIGGIWGMNVPLPLQDHPAGFAILIVFSLICCAIAYYWLKKNDFI